MRSRKGVGAKCQAGLLAVVVALAMASLPGTPAAASGGDHTVTGFGCRDESHISQHLWAHVAFSCLQIDASTAGGGSGRAQLLADNVAVVELTLDCVAAEESSSGHMILASGTDLEGQRAWLAVAPNGFSVGRYADGIAACGSERSAYGITSGAFTIGHVAPSANELPTPAFTSNCVGLTCSFDASASRDSEGEVVSYRWYVKRTWYGDHTTKHTGKTLTLTLPSPDLLDVHLVVVDEDGGAGDITREVNAGLPVPIQATPTCKGLTCTFDASPSFAHDGRKITHYHWNVNTTFYFTTTRPTLTHTFAEPGSYFVGVRVADSAGYTSPWMDYVTVDAVGTSTPFELAGIAHQKGQKFSVDLRWSGASSPSVQVFRNGSLIASVSTTSYSDHVAKGSGSLTYKVCESGSSRCSNEWTTVA